MTTTPTPEEALQKVREALTKADTAYLDGQYVYYIKPNGIKEAFSLIPIIEGAMVPSLPEDYAIESIKAKLHSQGYKAVMCGKNKIEFGTGTTPRAAILAAKGKVK